MHLPAGKPFMNPDPGQMRSHIGTLFGNEISQAIDGFACRFCCLMVLCSSVRLCLFSFFDSFYMQLPLYIDSALSKRNRNKHLLVLKKGPRCLECSLHSKKPWLTPGTVSANFVKIRCPGCVGRNF